MEIKDEPKFEWEYKTILRDLRNEYGEDIDIAVSCVLDCGNIFIDGAYYSTVKELLQPSAVEWKTKEYLETCV